MNKRKDWKLPIVFLIGYLFAWGMILVDRQMIIEEQEALSQELEQTNKELKLQEMVEEFGTDWQEMVIWNEEAIEPSEPKEVGK